MRTKNCLKFILMMALPALLLSSCRRDEEKSQWETGILTPLLKSSLNITNIVNDTLLQMDADSSLKVVYENHLYNMNLDSLFHLYDTSVTKIYKLDSISLLDYTITYPVSLGQIALQDTVWGPYIIGANGTTIILPFQINLPATDFLINADTLFKSMTLDSGWIDISITNGFQVAINNVVFALTNDSSGTPVASGNFSSIPPGTTQSQSISLAGKTIEGKLIASVSLSFPQGSFTVDTSNMVIATLSIHDLHPSTATAIFPQQNLINKSQVFKFDFDSVQLKEIKIKSGGVRLELYSTLQDTVHFEYKLPNAKLNGVPYEVYKTLPPAPAGGVSVFTQLYDFSDYELDLRGDLSIFQDTVNTMYNTFIARVDSTGVMRTLSLTDSMYAKIGFEDLTPYYARGYLGKRIYNIGPSELAIDIFKNINGSLQLQDVKLTVEAENAIGADAKVDIVNLSSYNSRTQNSVTLTGAVNNPINIVRATDLPPVIVSYTNFQLNNSNSNAAAFISNLPDKLNYSMTLETNPGGNQGYIDFIYADKLMEFNLNVEMPLAFIANDLTLSDTVDFSINEADVSRIKDGTLTLICDNGFPFDVTIQLFTLDLTNHITDSLFSYSLINAAGVDANNKVTEKRRSKLLIPIDQNKIQTFFHTKKMKIVAKFNTKPASQFYKVYSDYSIDFQLTGDFNYIAN